MASTKTEKRRPGRPATGQMPQHQFRCRQEDWEAFQQASKLEDLETSTWIRVVCLKAARRILKREAD
jgi:hypothetical protein